MPFFAANLHLNVIVCPLRRAKRGGENFRIYIIEMVIERHIY